MVVAEKRDRKSMCPPLSIRVRSSLSRARTALTNKTLSVGRVWLAGRREVFLFFIQSDLNIRLSVQLRKDVAGRLWSSLAVREEAANAITGGVCVSLAKSPSCRWRCRRRRAFAPSFMFALSHY